MEEQINFMIQSPEAGVDETSAYMMLNKDAFMSKVPQGGKKK
jgi:hypothetical protein